MASPGSIVIQLALQADKAAREASNFAKKLVGLEDAADDVDSSLSDAQRAMDKTGDTARRSTTDLTKVETALDGVGDEADRTAQRLREDAGKMAAGIKTGATDIDTETGHIKTNMKEAGSEAGAEFIGNMAEGIGSGSASVTDVVQGTLGGLTNLAASLGGPVGIAAGVAAAGVGLVFQAVTAEAERAKAQVKEIVGALVDLGETSSATAKQTIWDTWRSGLEDGEKTIGQIADGLRDAGIKQGLFKEAITGSAAAQKEVKAKIAEAIGKIEELKEKQGGLGVLDSNRLNALKQVNRQLGVGEDSIDRANDLLSDTELLTGDNKKAAEKWADEQKRVYNETHKIKEDLDAIPSSIPVNVIVAVKDKNGRPVHLGPGQLSLPEGGPVIGPQAAAQPVTVNVYATGPSIPASPRALIDLLETHTVRMGRKPGTPRAVAW